MNRIAQKIVPEYSFTHLLKIVCCVCLLGLYAEECLAQLPQHSIAVKPIRALNGVASVYQNEVKGGIHQIEGEPWKVLSTGVIATGMFVCNVSNGRYYQYKGDNSTDSTSWIESYLITEYETSNRAKFPKNSIILASVSGGTKRFFQSKKDTLGNEKQPSDQSLDTWQPLTQTLTTSTSIITECNLKNSKVYVTPTVQVRELTSAEYTLPDVENNKGVVIILKNARTDENGAIPGVAKHEIKVNYNTGESQESLALYKVGDYVRFVNDGTTWKTSGGNLLRQMYRYPIDRAPQERNTEIDALYFGRKGTKNSAKLLAYHFSTSTQTGVPDEYFVKVSFELLQDSEWGDVNNGDIVFDDPTIQE